MAIGDDKYAALVANGFAPNQINEMEKRFWAVMASSGGLMIAIQNFDFRPTTVTGATATLTATDSGIILADATAQNITITLPAVLAARDRVFTVKKIDASVNTVTVAAAGANTIDGTANKVISTQWTSLMLGSNGVNWFILSNN